MTLGTLLAEFNNSPSSGGWIHSVAFSRDGTRLCWVSHDSSINIADHKMDQKKLKTEYLPFKCCEWVGKNTIVAAVSIEKFLKVFNLKKIEIFNVVLNFRVMGVAQCCTALIRTIK